jgi:hypothetical protein
MNFIMKDLLPPCKALCIEGKGKGKVHPRTGCEGPWGRRVGGGGVEI